MYSERSNYKLAVLLSFISSSGSANQQIILGFLTSEAFDAQAAPFWIKYSELW